MRYKERRPTPHFKIPPPFNAVTSEYASLTGEIGVSPYCVLMQIAAEDTYDDYVICRGFDTRMLVFIDYEADNPDKPGISVAKPYGNRKAGAYEIGGIYPALLPVQGNATYTPPSPAEINLRLGQNPGVVDGVPEPGGQPSDLTASLTLLYDHNGIAINWMLIGGSTACEDLPKPGSYQAISGGTITAGTVGPIVYGGTVYQVKNHSRCDVLFGHEVGFHVDPDCNTFFVPCVCCDEVPGDCCDKSYSICINAQTHILRPWSVSPFRSDIAVWKLCCLTPEGFTFGVDSTYWLTGYLECDPLDDVIYFNWAIHYEGWTGLADGQGRIELAGLCENGTSVTPLNHATSTPPFSCDTFEQFNNSIIIHASDSLLECDEGCTGEPTTEGCCTKFLWLCINGDSQQLSVNGGAYDFDVTACCSECTSAELRVNLICNSESLNPLSLQWSYWCDGIQIDAGAHNISAFCTSNDPMILNFDALPCFLQLQVSIGNTPCDPCTSSDPCADPADCVSTACCVDDTPKALTLTIVGGAHAGTYGMTYDGMLEWINDTGAFSARMSCSVTEWQMTFEMDTYTASGCVPLTFDVSSSTEGITSLVVS